ncbi:MAG TPA: hypothetical protein VF677_00200 [Flavobacterium sp.]
MKHEDKIYNTIKNAAHKAESQDFPGMEKVWQRVENQLDHKVLKKETHLWKKIAVAASVLLVATLGYQLLDKDEVPTIQQQEVVIQDTVHSLTTPLQKDAIVQEAVHPIIKKNAEAILEHQTATEDVVVANKAVIVNDATAVAEEKVAMDQEIQEVAKTEVANDTEEFLKAKKASAFNASSASTSLGYTTIRGKEKQEVRARENNPLVVVDGTSITNKDNNSTLKKELSKLNANDVESIQILKEPLYIINGVPYSEAELFGPNPTSPYAPLNAQDIEATTILQGTDATSFYGKKGEKGVVIITTKDGKPAAKKTNKSINILKSKT